MNPIMPTAFHAMIAAPHYLASMVGGKILQQGGNAFDAAVAISAALAVVYPHMTGLGGDAFMLMYHAGEKRIVGLNGTGRSGRRATPDFYVNRGFTAIPQRGVESAITVPGMVDAWWELSARYGKLPWEALLAPAITYAEEGFPVSRNLYYWMCRNEELIRAQDSLSRVYMSQGKLLLPGDRLVQPELAVTLRAVQEQGRDVFYKGEVMQLIVDAIRKDGGCLEEEDFIRHHSDWVEPVSTTYRGQEIVQMPPNSQGFSALMMMNMLESVDLGAVRRDSAEFYHLMTEVVKKAFRDRDRFLTDPDFVSIPLDHLLSKEYARKLYRELRLDPPQGDPFLSRAIGQDTAYAAVVDEEGNAVSFIQSLYFDFGSAYVAGASGVLMQNRGSFFSLDAKEVNVLEPGKRCFHTLMPAMICRNGKPVLLFGTQGGEGQPQTQLSVMTGVLDYGCTIQEALALPRWVYGRTWGEDGDALRIENRGFEPIAAQLRQWGHKVELVNPWDGMMGQAQGISIGADGLLSGAADPRGDGIAFGW
ncbi:gamma-glutamyltransferase [Paenibacillus rigui]|uniref:Glutathione hydrolase proenzyme n=1 Tax=Paenibacillus rigui TaxID=554312 RepID=A0A229UWQ3_9BACL|nr:gamma-glutamyltransferase [Paenibacillus rigui]OXM87339.1 gamma-glutamyltransferase [Paenibacillus rigui]